ncbi:MAG TPA: hypothetical protein VKA54_14655, partial [Gemmatimonadaceae bacterium]|nr:hypothetical protein [Gemmatimonadaceae bacterium]
TERLVVLGASGPLDDSRPLVNGRAASPPPMEVRSGVAHRLRIVNISPLESHTVRLVAGDSLQQWRVVAKDGADLPAAQAIARPATVWIHPGETYDVELLRQRPESLTLRVVATETAAARAAFVARARPGEAAPRIIIDVPVIVRN